MRDVYVKLPLVITLAAAVCLPGVACSQSADSTATPGPMAGMQPHFEAEVLPTARWSRIDDVATAVREAYGRVSWAPLWSNATTPTAPARAMVRFLAATDSLGLVPADFDVGTLDSLVRLLDAGRASDSTTLQFDAMLSVATARALVAMRWGRVRQTKAYPKLPKARDDYDLAGGVYAASRSDDPSVVFDAAGPQWAAYRRLAAAYPALRRAARDSLLVAGRPVLQPKRGGPLPHAAALRTLLDQIGVPFDSTRPAAHADTVLDVSLSRALLAFQKEHRAPRTGVFDGPTRDSMRAVLQRRERNTVRSLERWRWLPRGADGRAILVNIPEFQLHAYDQAVGDVGPTFSMNVVVGSKTDERNTPLFADFMEHLIFSPYWEVPGTIAKEEIVPKAQKDSTYLSRNGYVLVRGYAANAPVVAPDSVNLSRVGRSVRVRQLPGSGNSLGRVKFMLPNDMDIYLHDTNQKAFFRRTDRALSHGCVRVSRPQQLAEWVLRDDTTWTTERIATAMKAPKPETVRLAEHIPVLLVYHTAAVDDRGIVRSYKDVYEYDRELDTLLARGFGSTK